MDVYYTLLGNIASVTVPFKKPHPDHTQKEVGYDLTGLRMHGSARGDCVAAIYFVFIYLLIRTKQQNIHIIKH